MTYYGARHLADAFRTVRKNTITIAEEIGDEHYNFRVTPENRSVAQTLVHIAFLTKLAEQLHAVERRATLEGFDFMGFMTKVAAEEQEPRTKAQILALLRSEGDRFASWLESVPEEVLAEPVSMPSGMTPPSKSRFEMLLGVKEHEMHHRGQLMLIERMIGIVPHLTREMQTRMAAASKR